MLAGMQMGSYLIGRLENLEIEFNVPELLETLRRYAIKLILRA